MKTYLRDLDIRFSSTSCVIMTGHFIAPYLFPHLQNTEVCAFTSGMLRDHIIEIIFKYLEFGVIFQSSEGKEMLQGNSLLFLDMISLLPFGAYNPTNLLMLKCGLDAVSKKHNREHCHLNSVDHFWCCPK